MADTATMKTKLWTGKTAKQELIQGITIKASVNGLTIGEALEATLDGGEYAPDGSMKREMQRYWDAASCATQDRIMAKCRSELKTLDRLYGRNVKR